MIFSATVRRPGGDDEQTTLSLSLSTSPRTHVYNIYIYIIKRTRWRSKRCSRSHCERARSEKAPRWRYVGGVVTYREEPPRDISIATRLRVRDKPDPHSFGCRAGNPYGYRCHPSRAPPCLPISITIQLSRDDGLALYAPRSFGDD